MSRTVKRWVAECDYVVYASGPRSSSAGRCSWNGRDEPQLHGTVESAKREAEKHALAAGHVGAREVQVRRTYKPRELEKEEVIG